jgi:methionyl-tRNA synthetase
MKMATTHLPAAVNLSEIVLPAEYHEAFAKFDLTAAANVIWAEIGRADGFITQTQPFKTVKTDKPKALSDISDLVRRVAMIAQMLQPFMPETAAKIRSHVVAHTMPAPLFARRD